MQLFIALCLVMIGLAVPAGARADTIVVAMENQDWYPYYHTRDGAPGGVCVEAARGAMARLGHDKDFRPMPWARLLASLEAGRVDAALCGTRNAERERYAVFPSQPLARFDVSMIVPRESEIGGREGVVGKVMGLVRGYSYSGVETTLLDLGAQGHAFTHHDNVIQALAVGRVDFTIDSVLPFFDRAQRLGLAHEFRIIRPPLRESHGYLMIGKNSPWRHRIEDIDHAIRAYRTQYPQKDIALGG